MIAAVRRPAAGLLARAPLVRATLILGGALLVCGCNTDQQVAGVPDAPTDYRMRHPITMKESDRTLEVFIGTNRGELNPTQRAQILSYGLRWKHDATGGIIIDRPMGSSNEHAAADAMREIVSILTSSGMPPNSIAGSAIRKFPRRRDLEASGPRTSVRAPRAIISKTSRRGITAAPLSVTSPPWSTIRPISCSRAPKPRPMRCGAPPSWRNIAKVSIPRRKCLPPPRRPSLPTSANRATKQSAN
jgi:pilus biogenesis lipoprotein CpaD